jgi:mannose-1-phosphate guanylyltransferase
MSTETSPNLRSTASHRFIVIMAGGKGERFWPVSREATPKQLITLLGGKSFLQQAVDRVRPLVPIENILIITNAVQAAAVRGQLPDLPQDNIIGEPIGRDTCAAVALGAALVGARDEAGVIAVLPADHVIPDASRFQQVLSDAFELATRRDVIVTIGIPPTSPETGYGYIQAGSALSSDVDGQSLQTRFFKAERFVEKPNLETAERYLAEGNFRWNAGMFVWSYQTIHSALVEHQPEIAAAADRWRQAAARGNAALIEVLASEYPTVKKISIDFAVMECARNVVVADGAFDWDDLGAWPALSRHLSRDADGNALVGSVVQVGAAGNIVYDARTRGRTPITLVGVKDSIVVLTDDAILVAARNEAQRIKELVRQLAANPAFAALV